MPAPIEIPDVASLKQYAGKPLGCSGWTEISQKQIDAFAQATGDYQWIHVDTERAALDSPFGSTIAHGYLTLSLVPVLMPQIVEVKSSMAINYGIDKLRLPAPVPAGSRVRLVAEIKRVREMPSGAAMVTYSVDIEVEGGNKPACSADVIYIYYP